MASFEDCATSEMVAFAFSLLWVVYCNDATDARPCLTSTRYDGEVRLQALCFVSPWQALELQTSTATESFRW